MAERRFLSGDQRSQVLFSLAIAAASAIGLLKTLLLAVVLQPAAFGIYAALFGATVMATIFISMGRNERTMKAWPRAWEAGDPAYLLEDSRRAMQALVKRAALLAALAVGGAALAVAGDLVAPSLGIGIALAALLVAPGIALLLVASGTRAIGSSRLLLAFTAARTGCALLLAVPLAWQLGWQWALAGELAAQAAVALWGWRIVRARFARLDASTEGSGFREGAEARAQGRTFYASSLVGSVVPFGGRGIIALLADAVTAGSYAVAMTFVQVAQMFTAAAAQREGPLAIKMVQRGQHAVLRRLVLPAIMVAALAAATLIAFLVSLAFPDLSEFWDGYGIGIPAMALTALAMVASFHMQMAFVILAFDGERHILIASTLSAIVSVAGFVMAALAASPPAGYIAGVAIGETLRSTYLLLAYRAIRRGRMAGGPDRGSALPGDRL